MPNELMLAESEKPTCECCGAEAHVTDAEHGDVCWECLDDLTDIEEMLEANSY